MSNEEKESKYVQYLPSIYQMSKDDPSSAFLGTFMKAFEKVLSGIDDGVSIDDDPVKGIGEVLDNFYNYFDPQETPRDFLNWLASWVALTLKEGETWSDEQKRQLISRIVPLYQKRGTREGLEEYLKIYVGDGVSILDELGPLRVGVSSRIGADTVIGALPPYFFIVNVTFPAPNPKLMGEKIRAIKEIIDIEKPAHTFYVVNTNITTLKVGYSRVELDTLLW
jgi:phage tail-like protein